MCRALDRYHWNDVKHLTVPNPDFGSKAPDAIRAQDSTITVYHRNQERIEQKGLAAPFNVESRPWRVIDVRITATEEVDTARKLAAMLSPMLGRMSARA
jgi:hypothetical protein